MSKERIIENLKKYVENEMSFYKSFGRTHGANLEKLIDRCYGALMYSTYLLSSNEFHEISTWWEETLTELHNLNND